jgi:hypothetical protein
MPDGTTSDNGVETDSWITDGTGSDNGEDTEG